MQITFEDMTLNLNISHAVKKPNIASNEDSPEQACLVDTLVQEYMDHSLDCKHGGGPTRGKDQRPTYPNA